MTVRLLADWTDPVSGKRYKPNHLLTRDTATETGLVNAKLADTNLTGGVAWVDTDTTVQQFPVNGQFNRSTGKLEFNVGNKRLMADDLIGAGVVNQTQLDGQPIGITRPVIAAGNMVCSFGTGIWQTAGALTLTQGYTGFDVSGNITGVRSRTGQAEMLKVVPLDNAAVDITLVSPTTTILTATLAGKIGLWVYLEAQPGYQPAGTPAGSVSLTITTNAGRANSNALSVGFNQNQLREGWNFLKFVQRNPSAYVSGTSEVEYHPFGISAGCFGTGVDADIVNNAITSIKISTQNLSGATLYFDSLWTSFESTPQIVFGCDSAGSDLIAHALPIFNEFNWKGYVAIPGRIWVSGSKLITTWTGGAVNARTMYDNGWENINHTANHVRLGDLTSPSEIDYEIAAVQAMYANAHMTRGAEFYASPQSSSSRLSDKIVSARGIKLQRHARKNNISITPWGIDNTQHVGAIDLGNVSAGGLSKTQGTSSTSISGWQTYTKIKRFIDVIVAYGDSAMPFWHGITTLGDTGSGEDLTGDNLLLTKSAFEKSCRYVRELEVAGTLRVCDGITGFYYGVGK